MKKIIKSSLLVLLSIVATTSCSSDNESQTQGSASRVPNEKSQDMMITDLYSKTSAYLKAKQGIKEALANSYTDLYNKDADIKKYEESYSNIYLNAGYYLQNQNPKSETKRIINESATESVAIAEFNKLIADPKTSAELANEYIGIRESIIFLDDNETNLTTTSDDCGWWQSWGKCTASVISGALFGAGGGCAGGAQVGALVTAPTGPGAAGGAAAGCVIGAVGGAIAGGLGGAVAGCDGCD
jgi:hypothetical protein